MDSVSVTLVIPGREQVSHQQFSEDIMAQLFQDDPWLHQPEIQPILLSHVFDVESMLHIIASLVTTRLVAAAPAELTSEISSSPLDSYSAIRSIKTQIRALEASSDYLSGNDMWLADAHYEMRQLYFVLIAKHAVQSVVSAL